MQTMIATYSVNLAGYSNLEIVPDPAVTALSYHVIWSDKSLGHNLLCRPGPSLRHTGLHVRPPVPTDISSTSEYNRSAKSCSPITGMSPADTGLPAPLPALLIHLAFRLKSRSPVGTDDHVDNGLLRLLCPTWIHPTSLHHFQVASFHGQVQSCFSIGTGCIMSTFRAFPASLSLHCKSNVLSSELLLCPCPPAQYMLPPSLF
jgi:hypothetical protein